jgi:hypothetical protein
VSGSTISIPPFIGPNDPGIIIGDTVPPVLTAYYAGFGATVVSAIIFQRNSMEFQWLALIDTGGDIETTMGSYQDPDITEMTSVFTQATLGHFNVGSKGTGIVVVNGGSELQLEDDTAFTINAVSQPRGTLDFVFSIANTAAIAAETVVLTSNSNVYKDGRAYSIEFHELHRPAGVPTLALVNFRKTNLAGVIKVGETCPVNGGDTTGQVRGLVRNTSGADVTAVMVATIAPFPAGTVQGIGAATTLRWMEIRDIGEATRYPGVIQI